MSNFHYHFSTTEVCGGTCRHNGREFHALVQVEWDSADYTLHRNVLKDLYNKNTNSIWFLQAKHVFLHHIGAEPDVDVEFDFYLLMDGIISIYFKIK